MPAGSATVRELTPETAEDCIATMIVKLARSLGLEVTAEGVETESQAQLLQDMGCKEMQGFLYGKPMNASSLEAWIRLQAVARAFQHGATRFDFTGGNSRIGAEDMHRYGTLPEMYFRIRVSAP